MHTVDNANMLISILLGVAAITAVTTGLSMWVGKSMLEQHRQGMLETITESTKWFEAKLQMHALQSKADNAQITGMVHALEGKIQSVLDFVKVVDKQHDETINKVNNIDNRVVRLESRDH